MNHDDFGGSARRGAFACVFWGAVLAPSIGSANVEITVRQCGFPTMTAGPVVRNGAWVPVVVTVDLVDQTSFDGSLRVAQLDADGDECFDLVSVHLRVESGGSQTLTLYIPANVSSGQQGFFVELLTDEGEAVQVISQGELTYRVLPPQRPSAISDDDILILSLSEGGIGREQDLVQPGQRETYARLLYVAHMSPKRLPDHWAGLEGVDHIIWDDAQPEVLTEQQLRALLEWVHEGGTLLLAASRSAGSLALAKPLYDVLPVDLGEIVTVDNLAGVRSALLEEPADESYRRRDGGHWLDAGFSRPVQVVQCTMREGATEVASEGPEPSGVPVVTRRTVGLGQVVFSAVTLKGLFSAPGEASPLYEKLLYLGKLEDPNEARPQLVSLFARAAAGVSFVTKGGVYLFLAAVCSIGYVVLATFGGWAFLTNRRWRNQAWNAFALVAIAASVVSVVVMRSRQGFGDTLRQLSIVDLDAGDSYGYATVLFGLKTSMDKELDVWLPTDRLGASAPGTTTCFLRPLAGSSNPAESNMSFADPGAYRLVPASAVIDDVRVRATLKQFEGRWSGLLDGTVSGEVLVRGLQIGEGSYVVNALGVDLSGCWLFHATQNPDEREGPRADSIYAYELGTLKDGEKLFLYPRCYQLAADETISQFMIKSTLAKRQSAWGGNFRGLLANVSLGSGPPPAAPLGTVEKALLLLSTAGELDPDADPNLRAYLMGKAGWSRDRLRRVDLRNRLLTDCVILVGFVDDPGPARLYRRTGDRRYRPLEPDAERSKTMYRVRLPVTVVERLSGKPAREEDTLLGVEEDELGLEDL